MVTRNHRVWLIALIFTASLTVQSFRKWHNLSHPLAQHTVYDRNVVLQHVEGSNVASHVAQSKNGVRTNSRGDGIDNKTLGFQKIFAINLPSRTDKRDGMLLASKLTGFDVEFMHGVDAAKVPSKALPKKMTGETPLPLGVIGCWRAHMNFLARVVQDDLTTALVLEDDVDWDVRLLQQLQEFKTMSHMVQDPMHAGPLEMNLKRISYHNTYSSTISPYGDNWDVLLLGNCGVDIDKRKPHVVRAGDETVPDLIWLKIYGDPDGSRLNPYPSRARLVGNAIEQTCTYAYAVTQFAARRLLLDLGLERLDRPFDLMLRDWCEGKFQEQGPPRRCIGILPSLFESYRREGSMEADSDVDLDRYGRAIREKASTINIRKSVRMNLRKLLDGQGVEDLEDQFPNFRFSGKEEFPARIGPFKEKNDQTMKSPS